MGEDRGRDASREAYREPVSPMGRAFLRPEYDFSIDCFVTFQNPVDISLVKTALASSLVRICPRFRSIVVTQDNGKQRWEELPDINVDNHVVIVPEEKDDDSDNDIYLNSYLAALPSSLLTRRDIPMWQVHVLPRRRRSLVLRFHHSLGDCVSLLAVVLACCDQVDEEIAKVAEATSSLADRVHCAVVGLWHTLKKVAYTLPGMMELAMLSTSKPQDLMLTVGEEGLERMPRKLASLALPLDDIRAVKNKLGATVNDVFVGAILSGLERYLETKSSKGISNERPILGVISVNKRSEGSQGLLRRIKRGIEIEWGNKVWYFVLPIYLKKVENDPLSYVAKAKNMLDRKKQSFEVQFCSEMNILLANLVSSETMMSQCNKMRHNTSLVLSNIVGPSQPVTLMKNLVTKIGVTLSSLPAALDVHMITYDGTAFLQFLVAEEVIPDPEVLTACVQKALKEMLLV